VLVLGIDAALLLFGHSLTIEDSDQSAVRCLALWAMMVMLIVDAYALAWVGLWEGLHTKNIFVATRRTLVSVLVLPWVFLIPTTFLAPPALISETVLGGFAGWFAGVAVWWGVIGFLVDFYYYNRCHRNLRNEFRKVVAEWFAPPVPTHRLDRYGLPEPWRAPSYRYY